MPPENFAVHHEAHNPPICSSQWSQRSFELRTHVRLQLHWTSTPQSLPALYNGCKPTVRQAQLISMLHREKDSQLRRAIRRALLQGAL